jgi:hypothetical protein
MGFDITELVASLGAYNRVHAPELYSRFLKKDYSQKYFRTISGVKDEYVADEFLLTEVLQPYQKTWTPKGDATFSPEIIKARRIKIDMEFDPVDLERTWEGERIDGSLPEGQELLEGYIMSQVLAKAKKEIEFQIAFKGKYVTPTTGVPGAAGTSADGLLQIVANAIAAGKIVPVPTGAITPANARESFELLFDSIDSDYQDQDLVALASPQLLRNYKRDYRTEFGGNQGYPGISKEDQTVFIDGTNTEIIPIPGMNGSSTIIITPRENLIRVIDGTSEDEDLNLRFQVDKRIIDVLGDFKMGWGFAIIEGLVWVNDPLTAPTVAEINATFETPDLPSESDKMKKYAKRIREELKAAQKEELNKIKEELWGLRANANKDSNQQETPPPFESIEFPGTTHPADIDLPNIKDSADNSEETKAKKTKSKNKRDTSSDANEALTNEE